MFAVMAVSLIIFCSFRFDFISFAFILFALSSFLSSLLNGLVGFMFTPIILSISAFIIYTYCKENKPLVKWMFFAAFIADIVFLIIFIIAYREDILSLNFTRLGDKFGDENDIAIFMGFGAFFSAHYFFNKKNIFIKIGTFISFVLFALSGFTSGSKIFLFIVLFSLVFHIIVFFGKRKWWLSLICIVAIFACGFALLQLPFLSTLKTRLEMFFATFFGTTSNQSTADISTIDRLSMFVAGITMFLRRPMFGWGIWGFATYGGFGHGWSHNHFSELLCNYGLVGFILFHIPIISAFYYHYKNHDKKTTVSEFGVILFFIMCMFSVSLESQKLYAYIIGLAISVICKPHDLLSFRLNFKKRKNDENSRDY